MFKIFLYNTKWQEKQDVRVVECASIIVIGGY